MRPKTIKNLDRWIGKPACLILTLWRRFIDLLVPRSGAAEAPKKILFIKMTEQGASVLAYSAISRAIDLVGRDNVYIWVFTENRPILDVMNLIPRDNVLSIDAGSLFTFARDILRTLWQIRELRIDATVDMEFFACASALLAYLTGASRRCGFHRYTSEGPYRGDLLTHRVQYNPYLHTAVIYHILVDSLLLDTSERPLPKIPPPRSIPAPPRLQIPAEQIQAVRAKLHQRLQRPVEGQIVLLNPNAGDMLPLRRWPTERFIALGQKLLAADPNLTVVLTGGNSEADACDRIAAAIRSDRAVSIAGLTTMLELLALYEISDVLVTNDSGPGHFASLSKIHAVVLFGPETPLLFGPVGKNTTVLWSAIACSPCVNAFNHRFSPCNHNVCMEMITVDQVYQAIDAVLKRTHLDQFAASPRA